MHSHHTSSRSADTIGGVRLTVRDEVFGLVPNYVLVAVRCSDFDPGATTDDATLRTAEDGLRARFVSTLEVMTTPRMSAWRAAYQAMGVNHSTYPNAAAAIARRVVKNGRLPSINWAVDRCNAASLDSGLPVAACTLDRLPSPALEVRRASGTETFRGIGSDADENPITGEVIYADATDVLDNRRTHAVGAHSRRWNWRQSDAVRTDGAARSLLLTVETVLPGDAGHAHGVGVRLAEAFAPHCGAVEVVMLRLGDGDVW